MRRKIAGTVGSVLLCALLLAGCSNGASTANSTAGSSQQETSSSTAASEVLSKEEKERKAALEESARKFKSAENYRESGEYFKAYSLYQKVIEDDSNYTEAQKRATEMLDLYWKQQDALVEQGEYQTAIENTASAMSFMGLTSPLDSGIELEKTILQVAEKLAQSGGFSNPKATMKSFPITGSTPIFYINIECDNINGKALSSLSSDTIIKKYDELSDKMNESIFKASMGFNSILLGDIHSNGNWYSVFNEKLTVRTDEEQEELDNPSTSSTSNNGYSTGGPGVGKKPSKSNSSASSGTNKITQEHRNALSRAESYYHDMDLSKAQVRRQLEFEGYEKDAIDYAMKNLT
ncbi:hypothetical protein GKG35_01405 [Faecalibacterium sp. BIOML-A3]|uniref:Ltp family lipoprotein n=1 Tax=unclassified Faecalibacterium TaxID=2646395 RepID=UPI0012B137AE|nr:MULTISPECIES: Ltp family lipoprotein [unclassified Faecalibacterium]MSD28495.1 hypothetical protein [Faecalibacterium sp. BIOML-A4]MSD46900.1 hypothetical protein [Faecalibacterium sp. BIOML-A3]